MFYIKKKSCKKVKKCEKISLFLISLSDVLKLEQLHKTPDLMYFCTMLLVTLSLTLKCPKHVWDEHKHVWDEHKHVWDEHKHVWDEHKHVWDEHKHVWDEHKYVWDEYKHVWDSQLKYN